MAEDQGRGVDAEAKRRLMLLHNDIVLHGVVQNLVVREEVEPRLAARRVHLDIEFKEDARG